AKAQRSSSTKKPLRFCGAFASLWCQAIFLMLFSLWPACALSQPYENFPAVVQVQSNFSDGRHSVDDLCRMARENSVKILILSDSLLRRWEYGLWPWRNIIKRTYEESSVLKLGVKKYLAAIEEAQKNNPDILIVPAVEAGPFYYWKGFPLSKKGLRLNDWHKKVLIAGLEDAEDFYALPVSANYRRLPRSLRDWLRLWPALLVLSGVLLLKTLRGRRRQAAFLLIVVGAISLWNNSYFPASPYDIYQGEAGIKPYQHLIDFVNKKGRSVFWLHPEASYIRRVRGVDIVTHSYKGDLARSKDYQGFSAFYYDNSTATRPGDIWDTLLLEYCAGRRKNPVWIIGELGFDGAMQKNFTGIQTIFLLPRLGRQEIYRALKSGRMYAKQSFSPNDLALTAFMVTDTKIEKVAFMGEEIFVSGSPKIAARLTNSRPAEEKIILRLIREGRVLAETELQGSAMDWEYVDNDIAPEKKTFYRLELESEFCRMLSNPIFVTIRSKSEGEGGL
ncbi:MAG: hypothetical protein ACOY3D_00320, partial [Candidatus Omnitrophota bacterium]